MKDEQISVDRFQKLLQEGYEPIFIDYRENFKTEGAWIREVNRTIKLAEELEEVLKAHGFDKEVLVVEVFPNIVSSWRVKWKETRSGSRRPTSIRKVTRVVGEKDAELYILVPRGSRNLAEKFLKLMRR
jgi:hypothetical protein